MHAALPVLFRDARFAVIDKPAGMPVHPVRAGGDSVEDVFPMFGRLRAGPWLAHRLDRDTSGCLVVALRLAALHAAQACFAEGRAEKTYWAITDGVPDAPAGVVRDRLARVEQGRRWWMCSRPDGQPAETDWRVRAATGRHALLELRPRTGRTHQIRVHCASLGCPIVGDPVYGKSVLRDAGPAPGAAPSLRLHARAIALPLAPSVEATAPPPRGFRNCLVTLGLDEGV